MPTSLGPAEIIVILIVALIVLGPNRLPEAGRQIGKALSEVRRWSQGVQDEFRDALDTSEPEAKTTQASPVATPEPEPPSAVPGSSPPPPPPLLPPPPPPPLPPPPPPPAVQ